MKKAERPFPLSIECVFERHHECPRDIGTISQLRGKPIPVFCRCSCHEEKD